MAMQDHAELDTHPDETAGQPALRPTAAAHAAAAIGWMTTIRARLLAAFAAFLLATIAACAIGIALFDNIGDLFETTVASGVRQYGATVRLREQATQLANGTASLVGADDRAQFEAAESVVTRAAATVADELNELRATDPSRRTEQVDVAFRGIFDSFAELRAATSRRIAAREPRVARAAAVLGDTAALDRLVDPRFYGDALDLVISIQGDPIADVADDLAKKRASWAADVERLQHMLQFRVAAAAVSAILAETSEVQDPTALDSEAARFAEAAKTMERFRFVFGDDNSPVAAAAARLIAIGRGDASLFALRRNELAAIAAEQSIMAPTSTAARRLSAQLRDQSKDQRTRMAEAATQSHDRLKLAQNVLLLIAAVTLCGSLVIVFGYVARRITGRLSAVTQAMTRLAGGDRETAVPALSDRDEIGEMARALQVFKDQAVAMSRLTERVTANIRQVAIAASQASGAVGQVSDGSKAQLGALEQSATALEQSAEAITEVAKSTERASEHARRAASLVSSGITQMDEMVEIVLAISQNSVQIRRIADAISQIAAQTNMLSLNAAIEAARAGEHGRGFSVVAEEVRKLAENAGGLAREIADQVRQSTEEAERGVTMVRQVSTGMQALAGGVRESDSLTNSIAGAMSEQQAIVADINRNVAKLTRIGQANAAAAEEITATMIDLSTLAETTRRAVDDFNTLGVWGARQRQ